MRAARFYAPGDVRVDDIPEPAPGYGEIKLEVAANGVCGSDLHEFYAAQMMIPSEPHPETGASVPIVLGHEFAGTVVEVGPGVVAPQLGDRVAVRPTIACGHCKSCQNGYTNICQNIAFHGLSAATGGLSRFSVVRADAAHVLPESVSLESGALVEPMAVAYHAVHRSKIGPGGLAVVAGLGPIGIGIWLALRAAGVTDVLLSDPSESRRKAVTALGAEHVIDPTAEDLGVVARRMSSGLGAEVVFDAAGVAAAVSGGIMALAPHGQLVVVGLHEKPMDFLPTLLVLGESEMVGSGTYCDRDFDAVIAGMARGDYPTEGWVTHAALDEIVDVFEQLRDGSRIKVLIDLE